MKLSEIQLVTLERIKELNKNILELNENLKKIEVNTKQIADKETI